MPPQIEDQTEPIKVEQEIVESKSGFPKWAKYILIVAGSILLLIVIVMWALLSYVDYKSDHVVPYMPVPITEVKNSFVPPSIEGIVWRETSSSEDVLNADYFNLSGENGKLNFTGKTWTATSSDSSYSFPYSMMEEMRDDGWVTQLDLDKNIVIYPPTGDGPGSSQVGYLKLENNNLRLIVFSSYLSKYIQDTDAVGFVYECPCEWILSVSESDPLNISDLINRTTSWKTYRNTKYGYEFKYPDNVGIVNEMTSEYAGPPTNPEEDMLLIADKEKTFYFTVIDGVLKIENNSPLGEKVISTFKTLPISTK